MKVRALLFRSTFCKKKPLPADWVFMNSCSKKLDPKTNLFSDQNRLYNWSRFENRDLKIKEYNWSKFENQRIQLVCVEQNLNSTQVIQLKFWTISQHFIKNNFQSFNKEKLYLPIQNWTQTNTKYKTEGKTTSNDDTSNFRITIIVERHYEKL